ncbi:MAG TPA: hypothetical protein DCY94_04775 [Firmicutes bacterium]|nr:hypothetical protein [Bacillota bacterium]
MEETLRIARKKQIEAIIKLHTIRDSFLKNSQLSLLEKEELKTVLDDISYIIEAYKNNRIEINLSIAPSIVASIEPQESPYGEFRELFTLYPYKEPITVELMKLSRAIGDYNPDLDLMAISSIMSSKILHLLMIIDHGFAHEEREYVKIAREKSWCKALIVENLTSKRDEKREMLEDTLTKIIEGTLNYHKDKEYADFILSFSTVYNCIPDISLIESLVMQNQNEVLYELQKAMLYTWYKDEELSALAKKAINFHLSTKEKESDSDIGDALFQAFTPLANFMGVEKCNLYFTNYLVTLPDADSLKGLLLKEIRPLRSADGQHIGLLIAGDFEKTYEKTKAEYTDGKENLALVLKAIKDQKNGSFQK